MSKSIITSEDVKKFQEMKLKFIKAEKLFKSAINKTNEIENVVARNLLKACLVPLGVVLKYIRNEIKKQENKKQENQV